MDDSATTNSNRSSIKRSSSTSPSLQIPAPKRRVVLGELTNLPIQDSDRKKPKRNWVKRKSNMMKKEEEEVHETEIVSSSVDQSKSECSSSIYQHLHSLEMEANKRPSPSYMGRVQNDISPKMRGILVDWLVEVAEEYKLVTDTLYLTVSYLDRYLSSYAVSRSKLQLLGVSCMIVASKYEEICPPHVEDFCYVTDNTYIVEEVLEMERDVVKFLNSDTGPPTTKNFLRLFTKAAQDNYNSAGVFEYLSCYLSELSLLDYSCVQFLPSVVAASAIFLSRFTIQPDVHPWSLALQSYTGYRPSDLRMCVLAIHDLQLNRKPSSLRAIREKYARPQNKSVAKLSSPSEIPGAYFEAIYP
ncbi:cyclin-A3-1-like [Pyrus x bretschneideri]|uniref:cyclin-A3-1-like n=1 Tax=Pyrus x bretschneideri TaxID=225117 RepID=UPI00202DC675|nr:cyclin-A3-1-like [Pyrus x bretschneideri]